ncbi:MAG TPA: MarR family transcriptional regulator [Propionicimonas sp.]|jgi:DNA-binding MarR family transcriptional regulator|uniref:MarR family winged helix-turn-helix transcriptional regulator n=1 Tax=Propionicimonas sp. TaxID=1955623 RepID=UPI002F3E9352
MEAVEELRYLVLAAQRDGSRRLAESLRPLGLTPAQSEVLTVLATSPGPLSVKELGELLVCETGSPSRLARSVVDAGWAEPVANERDGRVTRLGLTTRGQAIATQIAGVEHAFHEQLAATLGDPAALEGLVEALRCVVGEGPAGRALARRRATAG